MSYIKFLLCANLIGGRGCRK